MVTVNLQKLMDDIVEWSTKTFGIRNQATVPVLHHLQKEVKELIDELEKRYINESATLSEFADCFILLVEAAKLHGLTADDLMDISYTKLEENKLRKWGEPDEQGVIRHIK